MDLYFDKKKCSRKGLLALTAIVKILESRSIDKNPSFALLSNNCSSLHSETISGSISNASLYEIFRVGMSDNCSKVRMSGVLGIFTA